MTEPLNDNDRADAETRNKLSFVIIKRVLLMIAVLVAISLIVAVTGGKDRFDYVKDILSIILPLLATWIGTVLAFYYSRVNIESAAKQTHELINKLTSEQKLSGIDARDVMINMAGPGTEKLVIHEGTIDHVNLITDILNGILIKKDKNRLPIVDDRGVVLFIIHRSAIEQFIVDAQNNKNFSREQLTLSAILEDGHWKIIFQSFATIRVDDKLYEAKKAIDNNKYCDDVFVTEDGTPGTPARGWITNVIVGQHSVV